MSGGQADCAERGRDMGPEAGAGLEVWRKKTATSEQGDAPLGEVREVMGAEWCRSRGQDFGCWVERAGRAGARSGKVCQRLSSSFGRKPKSLRWLPITSIA